MIKIDDNTVQMTSNDLRVLTTEVVANKEQVKALEDTLETERQIFDSYTLKVNALIESQQSERAALTKQIDTLTRKLNAPSLELYGGYNTDHKWEGGVRLVWKLH